MKKIADIYINIPVKSIAKPYTYLIPEQFDILTVVVVYSFHLAIASWKALS